MKRIALYLFLSIFGIAGFLIIVFLESSKISDLIQFGILWVTVIVMYIPLDKQYNKEKEYQKLELNHLSKQLISIIDYIVENFPNIDGKFVKESIAREEQNKVKSMISELRRFDYKVLHKAKCELVDPSYSYFKIFDIYTVGVEGIRKFEYNDGYSYEKFHLIDKEIIKFLKARINRL